MSIVNNIATCDECNRTNPPMLVWYSKDFHLCFKCLQILSSIYHIKQIQPDNSKTTIPILRMPISEELRNKIYKRDNYQCKQCNSKNNLTIDHIFPFAKGGITEESNLQTLCKSCNSRKNAKVLEVSNG